MRHHVRYHVHLGHKIDSKEGKQRVTREEYNEAFGVDSPDPPIFPDAVEHVWEWWWKLQKRRQSGFDSQNPITYTEIFHWAFLTRTQITPPEVEMLAQLDDAFIEQISIEKEGMREMTPAPDNGKKAK